MVALFAVVALVLAGCGGGDEPVASSSVASTGAEAPAAGASEPESAENVIPVTGGPGPIVAEYGGAYSKWIKEAFVDPFNAATGYEGQVIDTLDRVQKPLAMVEAGQVEWDVLDLLDNEYSELAAKGALEPLPKELYEKLSRVLRPGTVTPYGVVAISFGYPIVCNKDTVAKCPTNAAEFFDTEGFPGKRSVYKDGWLWNFALALQADGVAPDELFPMDIERAAQRWETFKDDVDVYFGTGDQFQQTFRDGEVDISLGPDGRAWGLVNEGMDLNISYDGVFRTDQYFVVLKGAPHQDAAFAFLEWFATNPEAQGKFATLSGYGGPNPQEGEYVTDEVARTLVAYPANYEGTIPVDLTWVLENTAAAAKLWNQTLAG